MTNFFLIFVLAGIYLTGCASVVYYETSLSLLNPPHNSTTGEGKTLNSVEKYLFHTPPRTTRSRVDRLEVESYKDVIGSMRPWRDGCNKTVAVGPLFLPIVPIPWTWFYYSRFNSTCVPSYEINLQPVNDNEKIYNVDAETLMDGKSLRSEVHCNEDRMKGCYIRINPDFLIDKSAQIKLKNILLQTADGSFLPQSDIQFKITGEFNYTYGTPLDLMDFSR